MSTSLVPDAITDPNHQPLPGHLGNLTTIQSRTLERLKEELKEEGYFVEERMGDPLLLKFLRARKFNLLKSKEMIIDCEKWRISFGVENIVKNFNFEGREVVNKHYPRYYHKTDKDGRPLYIEHLGRMDVKALCAITTTERELQYLVLDYERCLTGRFPACSRAFGHPVETYCTIIDLAGVSIFDIYHVKDYISGVSSIGQNRYPGMMDKFYIINAPWTFSFAWNIVKEFLNEASVSRIQILGSNYQKVLLQQIPSENLPKEFGGECECRGGCSMSDVGPWKTQGIP